MPILFQYRNIRHLLGMYITKQAEQEIYLIAQKKVRFDIPFICQLSLPTKLCSRLNPASNAVAGWAVVDVTLKHTDTHTYTHTSYTHYH